MIHCETYDGTVEECNIASVINEVKNELIRACLVHEPQKSVHGGYAVILEEVTELQSEVFRKMFDKEALRKEAVQIAAMAIRFIIDQKLLRGNDGNSTW